MTTLNDIAIIANVSTATVSRILNGHNKGVRSNATQKARQVIEIAKKIGYPFEQNAAPNENNTADAEVAFLIRDCYSAPCDFEFMEGMQNYFSEQNIALTVITSEELKRCRDLSGRYNNISCIITRNLPFEIMGIAEKFCPSIVRLDSNERKQLNCINRDEFHAGYTATQKLIENGYEQIIFTGFEFKEQSHHHVIERQAGAEKAATEAGIPFIFISFSEYHKLDEHKEDFLRLLSEKTGVVAIASYTAHWCQNSALEKQLICGRDYGLSCCSGSRPLRIFWPQLSRVSFKRHSMGRQAAEMAISIINGKQVPSFKVQGEWVEGITAKRIKVTK